ncbi:tyrosine-type recombinase/integrase [Conexibacter sp. W3-3-2]|uniref:tyrosine-type recombinase/integrase n=1 Tax=Conexibacter sp. W3-3-2 TaxID=2675227 RepID=UPI0012B819D7|nr:site-specific integrase [Conexibacter sp. W3-3-2]MTD43834.1 tyrosine-type recombinase/integrase [Conexibacter sp. W3-3-2]
MRPELRRGKPAPNAGRRFPAEILTHAEIDAVLQHVGRPRAVRARNRALLIVLWRAGLRIAEALALAPHDLDLDAGTLLVRHGKGDQRRAVGLDAQTVAELRAWLDVRRELRIPRGSPLFCTTARDAAGRGRPVKASYVRGLVAEAARRARVDKRVHPHGFRHTVAIELLREGHSLVHIQKVLGHRDLATTARYVDHLLPLEAVEMMRGRHWPAAVRRSA